MKKIILLIAILGSLQITGATEKDRVLLPDRRIHALADDNELMWAVTDTFIVKIDKTNESLTYYNLPGVCTKDSVLCLMLINSTGTIYLYNTEIGLLSFDGTGWKTYELNYWITSLKMDSNDNLWFGSNKGLMKFDGTNWAHITFENSGMPYAMVGDLYIDDSGNMWLGNTMDFLTPSYTLVKFDGGTNWESYPLPFFARFYILFVNANGNVWFAAEKQLSGNWDEIYRFDGEEFVFVAKISDVLGDTEKHRFIRPANQEGMVWAYSDYKFIKLDLNRHTAVDTISLPAKTVNGFKIDTSGTKWIATDNGLVVYNENGLSLKNKKTAMPLPELTVFPNPVINQLSVLNHQNINIRRIEIFDIRGRKVKSWFVENTCADMDVGQLSSGTYVVKIKTDKGVFVQKIVKQ